MLQRQSGEAAPTAGRTRPARPALTVAAIIERDGRFLMVEEIAHGHRVFNQPAGHVEPGESLTHAVVRETLEETGWTFEPVAVTGVYHWRRPDRSGEYLRTAFCGRATGRDPHRPLDRGILQALWLTRDELLMRAASLRSPMVMRGIDDYLGGSRSAIASVSNLEPAALMSIAATL